MYYKILNIKLFTNIEIFENLKKLFKKLKIKDYIIN